MGSRDRKGQGECIPKQGTLSGRQFLPEPWRVRRGLGLGRVDQVEEH